MPLDNMTNVSYNIENMTDVSYSKRGWLYNALLYHTPAEKVNKKQRKRSERE